MRISDWSSDVVLFRSAGFGQCRGDVGGADTGTSRKISSLSRTCPCSPSARRRPYPLHHEPSGTDIVGGDSSEIGLFRARSGRACHTAPRGAFTRHSRRNAGRGGTHRAGGVLHPLTRALLPAANSGYVVRSEEHTSELQSLMSISYAVFCLK